MSWSPGGMEFTIVALVVLPLLFYELWSVRRSIRCDRERAAQRESGAAERARNAEGQHRLDP